MHQEPALPENSISHCIQAEYGLPIASMAFLPIGADIDTFVYRAISEEGTSYFVKLRRGHFEESSVELPRYLCDQGLGQVMAPIPSRRGKLWSNLDGFKLIVYPFVEGKNGYEMNLPDLQWRELGAVFKKIHSLILPPRLVGQLRRETYDPLGREMVRNFLARVAQGEFDDPLSRRTAAFLDSKREVILELLSLAELRLQDLRARPQQFVLCHSDLHAGNILIDAAKNLQIVDWDNPILAPRERDLMSVGAGLFGLWRDPQEEETLFYQGYGAVDLDPAGLAYYRYERIIQDIAVEFGQLLLPGGDNRDREQAFEFLVSNFLPNHVLDIARKSDKIYAKQEEPCQGN